MAVGSQLSPALGPAPPGHRPSEAGTGPGAAPTCCRGRFEGHLWWGAAWGPQFLMASSTHPL